MNNESIVEIRVPTYRRPVMLERALRSLLLQDHIHWRAVVLDDSEGREGEEVVKRLHDERVVYQPNSSNLGRVLNINYAFRKAPFFEDTTYACVLEDDNWYDQRLLSSNVEVLNDAKARILVRNYRIIDLDEAGIETNTGREPMRDLYGDVGRRLELKERIEECFFGFGLGNLSYFWSLKSNLDLSMSGECYDVHVAETGRALAQEEDYWYEPEVHSNFTRFVCRMRTDSPAKQNQITAERLAKLSRIYFTRKLLRMLRGHTAMNLEGLLAQAIERRKSSDLKERLAESASLRFLLGSGGIYEWKQAVKTVALIALYHCQYTLQKKRSKRIC
ncbi:glycosyltransferase [Phragmitibacter flavus]|nr:glycosyltransferase [Phragmitibacter flavus]